MSDYKGLLHHSRNYLISNIATKALLFFSIPVYTRLLSVEEYGIVNVFMSTISVAAVLFTLNSEVAIGRYYYDVKDVSEFKKFVGTSINLTLSIMLLTTVIFTVFIGKISELLSFDYLLTLSIAPVAFYSIISSVFEQIYNPLLQSKKIAIVSSVKTYLAFGLSVVFILLLKRDKYMGYVWGTILAMLILAIYLYKQIRPYYTFCFSKKHVKYIINYCLPYLPYSLSGVILAQFGRLLISNDSGFEKAGIYSFASNLAMVMLILIGIVHQAWNPYYFKYMNERDTCSLDKDYKLIWRVTLFIGIGVCLFGKELSYFMGGDVYSKSLGILPFFVYGYIFYQWSYVYIRICGYAKKTIWNAVSVITGGVVNVLLSCWLIPIYKDYGAALAFCVSYIVILIVSYLINKYIIKEYATNASMFLMLLIYTVPFTISGYYLDCTFQYAIVIFSIKSILYVILFVILTYRYFPMFISYIRLKKTK